MEELIFALIVLAIVLAAVTVVGHGLWLVLANVLGRPASDAADRLIHPGSAACPRCLSHVGELAQCPVCNWPGDVPHGQRPAALQSLRRQLLIYGQLGLISEAARRDLITALTSLAESEQAAAAVGHAVSPSAAASLAADPLVELEVVEDEPAMAAAAGDAEASAAAAVVKAPAEPLDPTTRVHQYVASRRAAGVDAAQLPEATRTPAPRRPAFGKLFAAFLEEKNVRWGELVGGLLIVCCSIALVISFWSEIADRPLLKFLVFNGVSAALFGAGFYTDRYWKIHTTSRGLLIIAILLVPLNFLAIAAFTDKSPPTDLLSLAGEGVSLALFTGLVALAARLITPAAALNVTAGVMLPSLMQLLTRRFAGPDLPTSTLYLLAAAPVASYLGTCCLDVRRLGRQPALDEQAANRLFIVLGIVSYATLLPLALLLHKTGAALTTLERLAPLLVLCGVPALSTGLLFWRRRGAIEQASIATAGIAVGVVGALVMVAAQVLAWPDPGMLLATSIVNAAVFAAIAWGFAIPQAHLAAGACALLAWLVGFQIAWGNLDAGLADGAHVARALLSASSGNALAPLAALMLAGAYFLKRIGRTADALWWAVAAALAAVVSVGLTLAFGFARAGDPFGVRWTYAVFAIVAGGAAIATRRVEAAWAASVLLLAALVQGVAFHWAAAAPLAAPWVAALLLHASFATAFAVGVGRQRWPGVSDVCWAWLRSALVTSIAAVGLLLVRSPQLAWSALAVYLLWLAVVWLVQSVAGPWRQLFVAFQLALAASLIAAVTSRLSTETWYAAAADPWLDPWFLQAQGAALALLCTSWAALRIAAARVLTIDQLGEGTRSWRSKLQELVNAPGVTVIQLIEAAVVVLLVALAIYGVTPGVCQELAPLDRPGVATRVAPPASSFAFAAAPHEHAVGGGAWLLIGAVAIMLIAALGQRRYRAAALGLLLAATAACMIMAAWWADEISVASALRWLLAGLFALASATLWLRQRGLSLVRLAPDLGQWLPDDALRQSYAALNGLIIVPYLAMMAYISIAAIEKAGGASVSAPLLATAGIVFLVSATAALALRAVDRVELPELGGYAVTTVSTWRSTISGALLALGAGPLLVTAAFAVAAALKQHPIAGPEPGAWFRQIGWSASYGVPLVVIAATLLGTAIRERWSQYTFVATLLANVVTTLVYLLEIAKAGRALDGVAWVEVAQINCIVTAAATLIWRTAIHAERRRAAPAGQTPLPPAAALPELLTLQAAIAAALCGLALGPAVVGLVAEPAVHSWVAAAGGPLGWIASGLAVAAVAFAAPRAVGFASVHQRGLLAVIAASLLALTAARAGMGTLNGYYTLLVGFAAAAWIMSLSRLERLPDSILRGEPAAVRWSAWLGAAAVVISLRALPLSTTAWWTIGGLSAMTLLFGWLAWISRPSFTWAAGLLLNTAASLWWSQYGSALSAARGAAELAELVLINIVAASAGCIASIAVLRHHRAAAPEADPRRRAFGFHRLASWLAIGALLLLTVAGLAADAVGSPIASSGLLRGAALGGLLLATLACLWDPAVRLGTVRLYCVGLVAVGMFLDELNVSGRLFAWSLALALAAFALLTSYLWSRRERLLAMATRWGVPAALPLRTRPAYDGHGWFVAANSVLAAVVTALVVWIELTYPAYAQRIVAAYAVLAVALGLALLAHGTVRSGLQYAALALGVLFAVALGWSWLPVPMEAALLHRTAIAGVALTVVMPLYGFGIVKLMRRENEWTAAAARLVPLLAALAALVFIAVLAIEVSHFLDQEAVPIRPAALAAVAAGLIALVAAALAAALLPGRDPLGLSERGRTAYVYAAEALLGLLFLHIRVTMPWLFHGWFLQFWPLVVMGVAFLGVGIAEWCRRRRQRVLFEPLENTGALLPMLPVLGYWLLPGDINYSLVLLSVGALYSVLSVLRRSFLFGVLAALAANGSLWYLLNQSEGLRFFQHPQVWLIPPALCVLAAAYLNRARLTPEQMTTIRYLTAVVIYASSTADIFVNGVGEAPWLPLVLAGLSLVGIFAGIWARVQAFLYLGLSFLLIALLTIIWYAAVELDRTWIWWVSGIVTGVLIIALFGLFEKKRDEILRIAERVRQWEA